jgi:acyl dehydratase
MNKAPKLLDPAAVGQLVKGPGYAVTAEEIAAFARATNDESEASLAGEIASPIYALNPVLKIMVVAKKKGYPGFAFHGEHDIIFHRPICAGMTVFPIAEVVGVHKRSTGATITTKIISNDSSGVLLNEQHFVSFVSGASVPENCGVAAPLHDFRTGETDGKPLYVARYSMDADQTRRYADASNDHDAYTVDLEVARGMGFPALLVHGMCTFAFSSRAIVGYLCGGAPERLRRLAVRLSRPVYLVPGQRIVTRIWRKAAGRGMYAFDAQDKDGNVVLTNGFAEVHS